MLKYQVLTLGTVMSSFKQTRMQPIIPTIDLNCQLFYFHEQQNGEQRQRNKTFNKTQQNCSKVQCILNHAFSSILFLLEA